MPGSGWWIKQAYMRTYTPTFPSLAKNVHIYIHTHRVTHAHISLDNTYHPRYLGWQVP